MATILPEANDAQGPRIDLGQHFRSIGTSLARFARSMEPTRPDLAQEVAARSRYFAFIADLADATERIEQGR